MYKWPDCLTLSHHHTALHSSQTPGPSSSSQGAIIVTCCLLKTSAYNSRIIRVTGSVSECFYYHEHEHSQAWRHKLIFAKHPVDFYLKIVIIFTIRGVNEEPDDEKSILLFSMVIIDARLLLLINLTKQTTARFSWWWHYWDYWVWWHRHDRWEISEACGHWTSWEQFS